MAACICKMMEPPILWEVKCAGNVLPMHRVPIRKCNKYKWKSILL